MTKFFEYLGGTVNELGGQSLLVNGLADHLHMLFVHPLTLSLSTLVEKVKANSSGWIKRRWRDGSRRRISFQLLNFLDRQGIDHDPRYVFV